VFFVREKENYNRLPGKKKKGYYAGKRVRVLAGKIPASRKGKVPRIDAKMYYGEHLVRRET